MVRWTEPSRILRIMQISADCPDDDVGHISPGRLIRGEITGQIIGAFYDVYNELLYGFLESVYAGALEVELQKRGIPYVRELPLDVAYKGKIVGTYRADFLVGANVIVEIKATRQLADADRRQLLHYLRATRKEVGLLLHFGPKAEFLRMVYSQKE
jgi:GxxExxY protein